MSVVVGLTGQSGSGKSFLSERFRQEGFPVINADEVSHKVTSSDPECLEALQNAFGSGIFDSGGSLNRKKLGAAAFSDSQKLKLLNQTVFLYITREIERMIAEAEQSGAALILLDAPTLYEAGAERYCKYVVAVCADYDLRLRRILNRDRLTREEAVLRLSAQKENRFYEERADKVLYNNGTKEDFLLVINQLLKELRQRFGI